MRYDLEEGERGKLSAAHPIHVRPWRKVGRSAGRPVPFPTHSDAPIHQPSSPHPSKRPPDDERHGGGRRRVNDGSRLEDEECGQIHPFYRELGLELSKEELEAACAEHVGGGILCHVVGGVELGGDLGDCDGDNGAVLEEEEEDRSQTLNAMKCMNEERSTRLSGRSKGG
jgi:hypothetical protein